jgi:hypothetical protein
MNWIILIIVIIAVLALLIFIVKRNQQDKEEFERQLNQDYHKTKDEEGDTDAEEFPK